MIRTSTDELTDRIKVDITSSGDGVTIKTDVPSVIHNSSFSVEMNIAIPFRPKLLETLQGYTRQDFTADLIAEI